jgi:hypothetical protein
LDQIGEPRSTDEQGVATIAANRANPQVCLILIVILV